MNFLLEPATFPWDVAIVLLLTGGVAMIVACTVFLRRKPKAWVGARLAAHGLRLIVALCALTVLYGSFIEPRMLSVTRHAVQLPLERRLKIIVLSDFHVGPYKGKDFVEQVVRKTNALMPDIVILTGDYVLQDHVTLASVDPLSPLAQLRPSLGTFAILGNHDHGIHRTILDRNTPIEDHSVLLEDFLEQLGLHVLRNQYTVLSLGTEQIILAGVDDVTARQADLGLTLAGIPSDMPVVLASHSPDIILNPLSKRASLIVAGHTHGGQIRLPFVGSIAALPTRLGRAYDQGFFQLTNDTQLAITRGVGESGPRARLFATPEIMMLEYEGRRGPQ